MPSLDNRTRATLKDSAFAYVDSQGRRRLPIHDAAHVRNALARFEQVAFEDDAARERAREKLLRAAKKHGIVPLGFFDGQIRKERATVQSQARPDHWAVTYNFRGQEHRIQVTSPPGPTVTVNERGEPRA